MKPLSYKLTTKGASQGTPFISLQDNRDMHYGYYEDEIINQISEDPFHQVIDSDLDWVVGKHLENLRKAIFNELDIKYK